MDGSVVVPQEVLHSSLYFIKLETAVSALLGGEKLVTVP